MTVHPALTTVAGVAVPVPGRSPEVVPTVGEPVVVTRVPGIPLGRPRWEARVPTYAGAGMVRGWTRADAHARMSSRLRRMGALSR